MNKIIILGGNSQLALSLSKYLNKDFLLVSKDQCNVISPKSILRFLSNSGGEYVINCAAITNLDYCEKNPKLCFQTNTLGPYLLNKICKNLGKKLIHLSSDYAVNPNNTYGWSKFLAEKTIDKSNLVIRTNFYSKKTYIVNSLLSGKETYVYTNLYYNPISLNSLSKILLDSLDKSGELNLFTLRKISYLDFAKEFCKTFNLSLSLIKPLEYNQISEKIIRPLNSYVKSDIKLVLKNDLEEFRKYLIYENS